jgi:ATP-dependent RNA helicase DDX1
VTGGGSSGAAQYGQQRGGAGGVSQETMARVQAVAPAVQELAHLEFEAQTSFFALKRKWAAVT